MKKYFSNCVHFCCFNPGAASCVRSGYGSEDEHPGQQQSQHAQGGPAHEPTIAPQHTQVTNIEISRQNFLFYYHLLSLEKIPALDVTRNNWMGLETDSVVLCGVFCSVLQVYRRVCPRGAAPCSHRGKMLFKDI